MRYFRIRNFDHFQHAENKNRSPGHGPWIKLYHSLQDGYEFDKLTDSQRWHLVGLFLLAARLKNRIPYDETYIRASIQCTSRRFSVEKLHHWIECIQEDTTENLGTSRSEEIRVLPSSDELPSPAEMVLYPPNGPALRKAESNGNLVTKLDTIWRDVYEASMCEPYPASYGRTRKHWRDFLKGQRLAVDPRAAGEVMVRFFHLVADPPESANWWGECSLTVENLIVKLPTLLRWMPEEFRLYVQSGK